MASDEKTTNKEEDYMYDAKAEEREKDESLLYDTIYDRGYFEKVKAESMINSKTAYIPSETISME